jgi:GDP-4-dehydro-6-deoxy-D-mannose reductase
VTGAGGFVGRHVIDRGAARGFDVVAVDLRGDTNALTSAAGVIHLASARREARGIDLLIADLELARGVLRAVGDDVPVLVPGSAAEYGMGAPGPLSETAPLAPLSVYGAAKAAMELALTTPPRVIWTRSFNHIGPGQGEDAPVGSWARQVVAAERAGGGRVTTGNLDPVRDFLDVRDVADAYLDLVAAGTPGIVNVGSGRAVPLREVAGHLIDQATVPIELHHDPTLMRGQDPPHVVADVTRLRDLTGFEPRFDLDTSIRDALVELRG